MAYSLDELADRLRHLSEIDQAAKSVFEDMALRSKGSALEVKSVTTRANLSRFEVVRVFKALAMIGVGEFKLGRKGAESRFEGYHRLTDIAAVARGNANSMPQRQGDEIINTTEMTTNAPDVMPSHTLILRANPIVRVEVPFDITVEEADRLSNFVKSLPTSRS